MNECNEHWCENYGANNAMCERCDKKHNTKDRAELRALLERRQIEHMELNISTDNNQGQTQ